MFWKALAFYQGKHKKFSLYIFFDKVKFYLLTIAGTLSNSVIGYECMAFTTHLPLSSYWPS